jgi:hypothetical protein
MTANSIPCQKSMEIQPEMLNFQCAEALAYADALALTRTKEEKEFNSG